jgi:hypothetical protein
VFIEMLESDSPVLYLRKTGAQDVEVNDPEIFKGKGWQLSSLLKFSLFLFIVPEFPSKLPTW